MCEGPTIAEGGRRCRSRLSCIASATVGARRASWFWVRRRGLAQRYDALVIGGGHNGLISAAYLARAGWRVLVLERRHVVGGAAVTEEIFPGFRFSVFSYVVSLLRPEIIRELDLPRHGLDILPLDGTFTPLHEGEGRPAPIGPDGHRIGTGDYLWRVNDHGRTIRELRRWGIPKGGTGGISSAIGGAARANGAEIRTEAPVARIRTRGGRALGVTLESGEEIDADSVVSSVDVRRTFIEMLEPGTIDAGFEAEVRRFKFRGSSGKVNLALDALPSFTSLPGEGEHLRGAVSISPAVDDMERAYDDAKYGRFSAKPYIDIVIPTLVDPSMAPPGKHIMSCFVQYAPYDLDPALGGWDSQREAFGDAVVNRIAEFAPDMPSKILHRQVLTPLDIERTTGLTEGNIFQGELSLEQLFFSRPVPGWARFRTPVRDLWLCGSSTHPGGGTMGANGRIAALELLRAKGKRA